MQPIPFQFLCGFETNVMPQHRSPKNVPFNSFADSRGHQADLYSGQKIFQFLCGFERRMAAEYAERNFAFNSFADSSVLDAIPFSIRISPFNSFADSRGSQAGQPNSAYIIITFNSFADSRTSEKLAAALSPYLIFQFLCGFE